MDEINIKPKFDNYNKKIEINLEGFVGDGFDGSTNLLLAVKDGDKEIRIVLIPDEAIKIIEFLIKWLKEVIRLEGAKVLLPRFLR